MENYKKSAHCTYDIKYHLVWITKYRKPILLGKIAIRTREPIRMVCQNNEVQILADHSGGSFPAGIMNIGFTQKIVKGSYINVYRDKAAWEP